MKKQNQPSKPSKPSKQSKQSKQSKYAPEPIKQTKELLMDMDSMLGGSPFMEPVSIKKAKKKYSLKDIQIEEEEIENLEVLNDDEKTKLIKKLVCGYKYLTDELNELKLHVTGTYCTQVVHDRNIDRLENKIEHIENAMEEMN